MLAHATLFVSYFFRYQQCLTTKLSLLAVPLDHNKQQQPKVSSTNGIVEEKS